MLRAREACVADIALQDCQWLVYLLMDGSEDTRVRNTYGVVRTVLFLTMCVGWTVPTGMLGCISVRKQSWFLDVVSMDDHSDLLPPLKQRYGEGMTPRKGNGEPLDLRSWRTRCL